MDIIPAIDLSAGQVVRLHQGDFAKKTNYPLLAVELAKFYQQQGAKKLHIVDLDGSLQAAAKNWPTIKQICQETTLEIQTGGGIRQRDQLKQLFDMGVQKVVIGSLAITNPALVQTWLSEFGAEKIVLAMDVIIKDGKTEVAINAWQKNSHCSLQQALGNYQLARYILCTDIAKDGTLQQPNFDLYKQLKNDYPQLYVQASGGISSLPDLSKLQQLQVDAAIVGKALLENRFSLREAIATTNQNT